MAVNNCFRAAYVYCEQLTRVFVCVGGTLDVEEFKKCAKGLKSHEGAEEGAMDHLFERFADGDGGITLECFQFAVAEQMRESCGLHAFQLALVDSIAVRKDFQFRELSTLATKHIFDFFDSDKSGNIDR